MDQIIGSNDLKVGQRVKVSGKPGEDGVFVARKICQEAPADDSEIEGLIRSIDHQKNILRLFNREFVLPDSIAVKDLQGNSIDLKDLKAGEVVKLKGTYSTLNGFVPEKIKMKESTGFDLAELQGDIDKIDQEQKTLDVVGFTVSFNEKATTFKIKQMPYESEAFANIKHIVALQKPKSNSGSVYGKKVQNLTRDHLTTEKPVCLFLNTYYPKFIESHYEKNPQLPAVSYQEQKDSLRAASFGDSDFYSEGLKKAGWNADDLIINCDPLQQAWAREHGFYNFSDNGLEIAIEQIRRAKPDVVYIQDLSIATNDFISAIRPYTKLMVGQIACPIPRKADIGKLDIIFSSFLHYVKRFREAGITSYYQPLAFEPRVLEKLQIGERIYPVTFIGGISSAHGKGKELLEYLAEHVSIDIWGYGIESLLENSPIRKRYHSQAWGLEMFSLFQKSFISINRHIDVAENYANNMRLFEATGCGALLITDYKDNLNELFEISKEVVAYRSLEECAALVKYYLANPEEAQEIARAGQARTLRDHTYAKRMEQTAEILERHLRYRRENNRFPAPNMSKISYGHASIQQSEISEEMTSAWQSEEIPAKQRALVQQELNNMYKGKPPKVHQVLVDCLLPYVLPGCAILEIGCASGYYYEVLEYLLNQRISYTGVDYSEHLISMAKEYYPHAEFHVADGANLPFDDGQFFIAISGCILLHVPNYPRHIAETARVAERFVVAHRTPVCRQRPTQYFKKFAYGVETAELLFNEKELLFEFAATGLKLIRSLEYHSNPKKDEYDVTYFFQKSTDTHRIRERGAVSNDIPLSEDTKQ